MPLQYAGIVEEHLGVRASAGVFDVSHMGKLLVRGPGALASVNRVSTNDVPDKPGRARYTHVCDDQGRVLDDVIFTVLGGGDVFCVCNAGPRERILAWFREHFREAEVIDLTQDYLCLAVQGPGSFPLLRGLLDVDPGSVKPFWGALAAWRGGAPEAVGWDAVGDALLRGRHDGPPPRLLFTRTGYTGEDGVELFPHRSMATEVWEALVEAGARPVGLGARDTLRLEKAYLLSGQDFDGARTSLEASGERWVKWDHEFIGREALRRQRDAGTYERLAAILLEERGVPRHGSALWHEGREVGSLTSGTLSPSLRRGIGLGYLPPALAVPGTAVSVRVRDRDLAARVVKPPFT
jgi:aminomethyltransferase